ncbi:MAG: hypothetical protein ABI410_19720 [Rhodoferax sp.]|uniref:hypothetical protein n=1 Tax=Rhodoferax sp. TaxID=50421 RepID=UPI00326662A3
MSCLKRLANAAFCGCISLLLLACGQASSTNTEIKKETPAMSQQVSIHIGELGPELLKRYPALVKVQHQPAGVDFYKIDWDQRPRGVVIVEHGKHSFKIEDVLGTSATQDLGKLASEGLSEIDIYAGMSVSSPGLIPHDEARLKTYALLQRILQAGWRPMVSRSDPRISGKARFDYFFSVDDTIGLDPLYTPSLEEWMRIESRTDWMFYADHLYMTVSFTRERTLTDPTKPGSYLLNFNVKSEAEYFRGFVEPLKRDQWKELLPAVLAKLAPIRAKTEAELRAKGVKINESYEETPLPSLK